MKKIHFIFFVFLLFAAGCSKTTDPFGDCARLPYSGTLTGPDLKMNPCSGGVYLKTDQKIYHIEELPGMSQ
jgi:hypothetical protein